MNYDCLTVGNAVIDAFLTLPDDNQSIQLNKPDRLLCVPYGQKIPLKTCEFLLGGNACNVAVGLRRAGFMTSLVAELADDEFSEKIRHGLMQEKVDLSHSIRHKGQSSFSIGLNFKDERTLFVEHPTRDHLFSFEKLQTKLIYLTSLGHSWTHVYKQVAEYLQRNHESVLAFNPGSTQFYDGVGTFMYLLPLTTLLFVNKEEAEKIAGVKGSAQELLELLKKKGPRIVILTDGEKGSYCIDERGTIYHKDCLTVPVVERTGAGDAYASGFLAGYLSALSIDDCMRWGTHNAASVIGQSGAQPGLLLREELIAAKI